MSTRNMSFKDDLKDEHIDPSLVGPPDVLKSLMTPEIRDIMKANAEFFARHGRFTILENPIEDIPLSDRQALVEKALKN